MGRRPSGGILAIAVAWGMAQADETARPNHG